MKDWGMMSYPRQGVHLSLNAVNDWGRTGRIVGQAVESAGHGLAELLPSIAQVARAGLQADIAASLENIAQEATEELMTLPVRDWDYSWQQAYEPRVQELVAQYDGADREAALRLSEEYGRRYSLDGRRKLELGRVQRARQHWQEQVDSAVQRGDADSAHRWVEHGRGVFVPESEMQQSLDAVRHKSLQHSWLQKLQVNPTASLAAWKATEVPLPENCEERRILENEVEKTQERLFHDLSMQLGSMIEQGSEPDMQVLTQAVESGLLNSEQVARYNIPRQELLANEACDWLRRIDERDAADDARLTVDIALAPIPNTQKRMLLQRMQSTAAIPAPRRVETSRTLWNLYRDGRFGCPGDTEALQCLGRLQEEAGHRMQTQQEKEVEDWLSRLREPEAGWVCFE